MENIKIKVSVLVNNNKDEVLLIKEKISKKPLPLWNIIKGTYGDNGSETLIEAAKRECLEEAGIEVDIKNLINISLVNSEEDIKIQFNFLGVIKGEKITLAPINDQISRLENITDIKWFSKEEIKNMSKESFISNRTFEVLNSWIKGEKNSLDLIKVIKE
ncbi:MAG: hypothetical protein COV57_01770 [Candidatus Liptonbacteria bacterium CG11_big_fil_rev_8_21_14_0_20_35_14]|uniref:Nudix hydrolase domain-containing protein n=1 Tax=Candidatus Liptonbacteria bacterium CG11_big_fil_rev_8_21_14_0_20_35_14 TaxID=1974634 RepID=A0A2H0NA21_9BACT|nr:MAG: hypothetical protein COV57_01770 [Candidatus Liptonbacteria bacterium CG11_big_fil_rev_8_21_14_0_20_35_14]